MSEFQNFMLDDEDADTGEDLEDEDPSQEEVDAEEGACCADCGAYFTEASGKPVLCHDCHEAAIERNEENIPPESPYPVNGL